MTRIDDLLRAGRTFSFEFFPPRTDEERLVLVRSLRELEALEPSFVSITYRGGRSSRQLTTDLVAGLRQTTSLTPMAHLICTGHSRLELADILVDLRKAGVENLMALGGDPPTDPDAVPGELEHASELVELARAIGGFSIGVAAHPIGHPRSPDRATDRRFLAEKLERADFAVTQFFYSVEEYVGLVGDLARLGVDKPVIPGIMPVTNVRSVPAMAAMGAPVPEALAARLDGAGPDREAVRREGVAIFTELCEALLGAGAPGLHFYTLNRSTATREIYAGLGLGANG
ncbi:MAG TPA: methylenetetrahydrofolate reductase [Candidatus Saccharimonadales bacterium]|nr:methylenetetrahydrofolate reductase [Acidimicrobiales bacterium]HVC41132.1 methylenetetrahydrofolate reductase [Candidatus Saccharimonadales bacterium]